MKAILSKTAGGPDTLAFEEIPDPQPGEGEILIDIKACAINYPDVLVIADKYQYRPQRPFIPGSDIAGMVRQRGAAVAGFEIGDRVLIRTFTGGLAEKIAVTVSDAVLLPAAVPFEEGASLATTYGTSYYALHRRAALRAGETLLVLGAAGGVGIAAVELGREAGARVVAGVSSEEKAALVKERGAEAVVIYPRDLQPADSRALAQEFKTLCGPEGADVIYDPIGGPYAEAALRAIAWEGRYLVVGFTAGIPSIPLNLPLLKSCQIVGVAWGAAGLRDPEGNKADLEALLQLCATGRIRPLISATYPLARGAEAIAHLAARQALGKVVVVNQ